MKANLKSLTAALIFAATATTASAAEILIDNFDNPSASPYQIVEVDVNGNTASNSYSGAGILGGTRDLSITCDSGCIDGARAASLTVAAGELAWVNDTNVRSTAAVEWDAGGAGLNLDLVSLGSTTIVATVLEADLGFNYTLTLWSSDTDYTSLISGTLNAVIDGSPEDAFYQVSWFDLLDGDYFLGGLPFSIDNVGSGVDITNVNKITFAMTNTGTCYQSGEACSTAVDLRLDNARLVPEPSSVALLGFALLGLAGLRMRKQA